MTVALFDTHSHLDASAFDADRAAVIERARAAGVTRLIAVGAGEGLASSRRAIALAEQYPYIWASAGLHPHDAARPETPEELEQLAQHPAVKAIGETGLDFHYDFAPRRQQEHWFRLQIEIARRTGKPLIVHCREAAAECLTLLQTQHAAEVGGVFHCYSEDEHFATQLRDINFKVSFTGILSFKKSQALRRAAGRIPLAQVMLETDAPYLAPEPLRGRRCESAFLTYTAQVAAELWGVSLQQIAEQTTHTACEFFGVDGHT